MAQECGLSDARPIMCLTAYDNDRQDIRLEPWAARSYDRKT